MADHLHDLRGLGYGSRFRVSEDSLPPGWRQVKKSHKYTAWFDDRRNKYKTSSDVERAVLKRHTEAELESENVNRLDQEPIPEPTPTAIETGETSEFEESPVKRP